MTRNVYRHHIRADFHVEILFDAKDENQESFQAAMKRVSDMLKTITSLGGKVSHDKGKPGVLRDLPEAAQMNRANGDEAIRQLTQADADDALNVPAFLKMA